VWEQCPAEAWTGLIQEAKRNPSLDSSRVGFTHPKLGTAQGAWPGTWPLEFNPKDAKDDWGRSRQL
jgi:hypothetical protein